MLKRLRYQLTLLYLLAGLAFFVLIGGGAYALLTAFYQRTTDLALQYKAAQEFQHYGVSMPLELENAHQTWGKQALVTVQPVMPHKKAGDEDAEESENGIGTAPTEQVFSNEEPNEHFDANLAPIFTYAVQEDGRILGSTVYNSYPIPPDIDAIQSALAKGVDWRTVRTKDDERLRLLTYRLSSPQGPALIQLGRLLNDQDYLLSQFLIGMVILGLGSMLILGAASWWLAGRSLTPAQQAWERQQDFIANASHELRTPLTVMRAAAEIALRGHPNPQQQILIQDMLQETNHMGNLVENLLLLSRLDAGRMKFDCKPIALEGFLNEIYRQMKIITDEKGIEFVLQRMSGKVWGDETHLRQVLFILLDNAMRHTSSPGRILIDVLHKKHFVQIRVVDNGVGIAREHLGRVFERFYQIPGLDGQNLPGNGLGLSIARGLVEGMDGKIFLESTPGQGTQAIVELPLVDSLPKTLDD